MTTLANLVEGAGAKFRADLANSDRVSDPQWATLANAAVLRAWTRAAGARPDFQVASQDFTVASGQSASISTAAMTTGFFSLIDVVANPDTGNEFSLGPFMWQNRKAPGNWGPPIFQAQGAQRARLMGSTIYLEPATSAGGTYRVWYCPKPTAFGVADFTVRATSPGTDIASGAYTATGLGVGKTLTSTAPGTPLSVDGIALGVGDRFLLRNSPGSINNGIYALTQIGSGATPWAAVRATDYDSNSEVKAGQLIFVQEGTLAQTFWTCSGLVDGVDQGPMTFAVAIPAPSTTLDAVLDPFAELLQLQMAITAVKRDDRAPEGWMTERDRLESDLSAYFRLMRGNNGPSKTVDTDARGPAYWMGF